jgi:integrase
MPRRLPPGCVEDRDRPGTSASTTVLRVDPSFGCAARRGPRSSWHNLIMQGARWRRLCTEALHRVRGVGSVRSILLNYLRLDERTRRVRRGIIEATFDEPIAPGSPRFFRDMPLTRMTEDAIEVLRDRKIQMPEGANARLKAIRQVFKFGVKKKLAPRNPARDVEYFKSGSAGFHPWTPEEVQQFEARHPVGTKARLALALMLFTGQRRSDIVRFGKQHAKAGKLSFTQYKGRNRKPKRLTLPILPALQKMIDATPCGDLTFLVNEWRRPFTDAGFGNWFRDRCVEAGVPGRAHGLRKAGATIAANNGATSHQLMAIFGWDTKEAERYTRAANQLRLAEAAMHMLETPEQYGTEPCPTEAPGGTFSTKS